MTDDRKLGSSGVFQAIVEGARKFKRAVTGGDEETSPEVNAIGEKIGQAFVAGRFAAIHELGTPPFQKRTPRDAFVMSWQNTLHDYLPLTGFRVVDAGQIELGYIPGLEEVSQGDFVAFLQITFSNPDHGLDAEGAFVVGVVLLDHDGAVRVGALHAQ